MAFRSLHDFMGALEHLGQLHRVRVEVDPVLEIAEITSRVCKQPEDGKALLFERVKGSSLPVVTNLFGSWRRMCLALGIEEPQELTRRMEELLRDASPDPWNQINYKLAAFEPVPITQAACQEIVENIIDLDAYPALKSWPGDGLPNGSGRFLTLPLVFTRDPENGRSNCGMYRVELFDRTTCGIHWRAGSGAGGHYARYDARGEVMPVAIALGGDPSLALAATLPLPETIDEMRFSGFLSRRPMEVIRCRTCDLSVPADAELIIEGFIKPGEYRQGGAFGNHTGYYAPGGKVPVLHVACITRRRNAVLPATVVGRPPMEDCYLAKAMERLMLPVSRHALPELVDISMPLEGIFHGGAIVSIKKTSPAQGRRVIESLWAAGWLCASRLLIVVDADVNPHDSSAVAWRVFNNVDWERDLLSAGNPPNKDSALPFGGKLGIDATRKLLGEMTGDQPSEISMTEDMRNLVGKRWREYGL